MNMGTHMRYRASDKVIDETKEQDFAIISDRYGVDLNYYSYTVPLRLPIMKQYIHHNWDWKLLAKRLTVNHVRSYHEAGAPIPWEVVSGSDLIDFPQDVESNIDLPWNFHILSVRKGLECDFILRHMEKGWPASVKEWAVSKDRDDTSSLPYDWLTDDIDFFEAMSIANLNGNVIERNIDMPWNYAQLYDNENIDVLRLIIQYPDKPWDYQALSWRNGGIVQYAVAHPELPFDRTRLTSHTPLHIIVANPQYDWNPNYVSYKFMNLWPCDYDLRIHATVVIQSMYRRHIAIRRVAVLKIENAYFYSIYNPSYALCKRRLRYYADLYDTKDKKSVPR